LVLWGVAELRGDRVVQLRGDEDVVVVLDRVRWELVDTRGAEVPPDVAAQSRGDGVQVGGGAPPGPVGLAGLLELAVGADARVAVGGGGHPASPPRVRSVRMWLLLSLVEQPWLADAARRMRTAGGGRGGARPDRAPSACPPSGRADHRGRRARPRAAGRYSDSRALRALGRALLPAAASQVLGTQCC